MKKKALVTGGAGFIGSNLTQRLLDEGWEVTLYDNLSRSGSEKNLFWLQKKYHTPKLKIEKKDVRNYSDLKEAVRKVDVIFHLAAQVAVTSSVISPREDFEVNALGTFNVLEAAREAGHKPIVVYASTNKVYGAMQKVGLKKEGRRYGYVDFKKGIDEEYPLDFHSPYGCSKGAGDQYTQDFFRIYGLPTVVFRQSCIYGPRQMGVEEQGWVAHFAVSALLGKPITIFGDGKQVRDILYVDDLISAYLLAVEKIGKAKGEVFNIGGGVENCLSLLEYINILEEKLRKKVKKSFSPWRPGDQKIFIADCAKVESVLGWKKRLPVQKGIDNLLYWIKHNRELFK